MPAINLWWIALTICVPLGENSPDCARVVIHPRDLEQLWEARWQCERILPKAVDAVEMNLEASGWGAAWVEGAQCERQGDVM